MKELQHISAWTSFPAEAKGFFWLKGDLQVRVWWQIRNNKLSFDYPITKETNHEFQNEILAPILDQLQEPKPVKLVCPT